MKQDVEKVQIRYQIISGLDILIKNDRETKTLMYMRVCMCVCACI